MAWVVKKRSCSWLDDDVINTEEMGEETQAEKQMKAVLEKQLNTKITLAEQFSQHREFVSPSTYQSLSEIVSGTCSLKKFRGLEKDQELREELQRCELTCEEIEDYLNHKASKGPQNHLLNPAVYQERIKTIEFKIQQHNENLLKPQNFVNVKKLTRHEMELERSLYAGCEEKKKLAALVVEDQDSKGYFDSAFEHVKGLSEKLMQKKRLKKKKHNESMNHDNLSDFKFDANIHHVVVPLCKNDVSQNQLSLDEVKKIPRFENYEAGIPSNRLYIKNLHKNITVQELRSVFSHFEEENNLPIDYKLCSGRMRGQAFIQFSNAKTAEHALKFSNGLRIRNKPMIVQFGRKT